jgi:hypothetical protein
MSRFTIVIREIGSDHDVALVACDSHPEAIAAGLRAKVLTVGPAGRRRITTIPKYTTVRIVDHEEEEKANG